MDRGINKCWSGSFPEYKFVLNTISGLIDCQMLEWTVLNWNASHRIALYFRSHILFGSTIECFFKLQIVVGRY